MLRITIDKELTTLAQESKVRADARQFRTVYTENDLLRAFCEDVNTYKADGHDVLSVSVEAFPAGTLFNNETTFHVTLLTHGWKEFCEIDFYCDINLNVDKRDLVDYRGVSTGRKLYSCEVYKRA